MTGSSDTTRLLTRACTCLVALTVGGAHLAATADTGAYAEYEVKAAMLYNFARFVDWPPQSFGNERAPVVIGILGTDPFGKVIDEAFRDKLLESHPIQVRRFRAASEVEGCQILFIARSEKGHIPATLAALKAGPLLTVSDVESFAQMGGVIELTLDGSRLRFEVNQASARQAGLTVSSKLLKLASRVRQEGGR